MAETTQATAPDTMEALRNLLSAAPAARVTSAKGSKSGEVMVKVLATFGDREIIAAALEGRPNKNGTRGRSADVYVREKDQSFGFGVSRKNVIAIAKVLLGDKGTKFLQALQGASIPADMATWVNAAK